MSILQNARDGWANVVKKIGLTNNAVCYQPEPEPSPEELSALYDGDWLARRIVDMIVDASFERGFRADGHEEDWHRLNTELYCDGSFQMAARYGRLHGGALLVGGFPGDLDMPVLPSATAEWFEPISCVHVQNVRREDIGGDPSDFRTFQRPLRYRILSPHRMGGQVIDASRVIVFDGIQRAPTINDRSRGHNNVYGFGGHHGKYDPWGISVLVPVMRVMREYGVAWGSISDLLQVSSVGVMKMAGLIKSISRNDGGIMEARAESMQTVLSLNNLLMLDADHNEEYTRIPASFADVPHLLTQFTTRVAGAIDAPVSILFGQQPGGMNSNSDSDRKEWDGKVDAYRRRNLTKPLQAMLTATGTPEDIEVEWGELQVDTRQEIETMRATQATTDRTYWQMGVLEPGELRRARVEDGTLGLDIPAELPEPPEPPPTFEETPDAPTEDQPETDTPTGD